VSSFVLTTYDKDTVEANLLSESKSKVKHSNSLVFKSGKVSTEPNEPEVLENQRSFKAVISSGIDTAEWLLSYVGRYNQDSSEFQ